MVQPNPPELLPDFPYGPIRVAGPKPVAQCLEWRGSFTPVNRGTRLGLCAVLTTLLVAGCAHRPPKESGNFRAPELVELTKLDPTIRLDIRYATTNNFLHRPVYSQARAFLQRPAAAALVRANEALRPQGYGL